MAKYITIKDIFILLIFETGISQPPLTKSMKKNNRLLFLLSLTLLITACNNKRADNNNTSSSGTSIYLPKNYVELKHPEWSKSATLYEVNVRKFTPQGTSKAFKSHLPRLKEMGIDTIWLMPVHPIGEKNCKGILGSYYAVKGYYGVNPEFGTMEDFKTLVKKIHDMGIYVISDWVANHSASDNALATEHPDWYIKTREDNFEPTPWRDYDDIIDFDYNNPGLRKYMTGAMKYWIKET